MRSSFGSFQFLCTLEILFPVLCFCQFFNLKHADFRKIPFFSGRTTIFFDLKDEKEVFEAHGDIQFNIYRSMRKITR